MPAPAELQNAYSEAVTDARLLEQAQEREYQSQPLTPDEKQRLERRWLLERQYLG